MNIVNRISAFLSNRSQQVSINGTKSVSSHVTSGVPEESVLRPSLFLLYIYDLVNVINNSDVRLYANDVKLFREVVDLPEVHLLQADLDNLFKWAQTCMAIKHTFLLINVSVYVLVVTNNNLPVYSIDNIAVPWTAHMRDLGVTI